MEQRKLTHGQPGSPSVPDRDGSQRSTTLHCVHDDDVRAAAPGIEQRQPFPAKLVCLYPQLAEPTGNQYAGGVV